MNKFNMVPTPITSFCVCKKRSGGVGTIKIYRLNAETEVWYCLQ